MTSFVHYFLRFSKFIPDFIPILYQFYTNFLSPIFSMLMRVFEDFEIEKNRNFFGKNRKYALLNIIFIAKKHKICPFTIDFPLKIG